MTKQDFSSGMDAVFKNLQYPFYYSDVKRFDTDRGGTFIELNDGRLYWLKLEQLDTGTDNDDLKGVI